MMSDIKRLSVNNFVIEGFFSKVIPCIPCIHIHDDGSSLTMTSLTIQKKEDIKEEDTFLTSEQFLSFVSQPSQGTSNLNGTDYESFYDSYDNLYIEYKHFPGVVKEIFDKFEAVLKIRMKMTFKFISPVSKDYNWVGFMKYFLPPSFNNTSNMIMGSMKLFDFDGVRSSMSSDVYHLNPSVIIKIPGNNQKPNFNECDIVILNPDPGYYCNLELKETSYNDFEKSNYGSIVIDTEVLDLLKNSELRFQKKLAISQNSASNILGPVSTE